ncbi:MAG: uroporphyrinogen decarboxylase family protein, partial [Bacillota bacterium]
IVFSGGRLNRTAQLKTAIYMRGLQQIMEDIYFNPSILEAILERVINFYIDFNQKLFEASSGNLDIFMMGDDFGIQDNLICSKKHWIKFFKPGLKKFIDQAKKYNLLVMHHSCGAIAPLIPDFIELGLDILNPIQIDAKGMDPAFLKKEYGRYITFHGGVSIQKILPYGSPVEVKENVKNLIDVLGEHGGYIACTTHNLQEDIPLENIEALFAAYNEYRKI